MIYERDGRVARITLNRPERGNGITLDMPRELAVCVERANLDPEVHAIALAGNGSGFCGGYDLAQFAEGTDDRGRPSPPAAPGLETEDVAGIESPPVDPAVMAANHDAEGPWAPVVDFQMMWRN